MSQAETGSCSVKSGPALTPVDRAVEGLPFGMPPNEVALQDGATYRLAAAPVRHDPTSARPIGCSHTTGRARVRPLRAPLGANRTMDFENRLPFDTTVH